MPSIKDILVTTVITFFTTGSGHMILDSPPPYGNPDSSPLILSGSNFPCKGSSNAGAKITTIPIGSPQTLSFKGIAVHGGGSCQLSLTKDTPATKQSTWQVIHSIVGGCPAWNLTGNMLIGNANSPDPDKYSYTIPEGITPGDYTFAWTWFNNVGGSREMYMNCASIKVTGGSKKRADLFDSLDGNGNYSSSELTERGATLPDMFVANIQTSTCMTHDASDVEFPDPGPSVLRNGTKPAVLPFGTNCGAASVGKSGTQASNAGSSPGVSSGTGSASGSSSGSGLGASTGAGSGSDSSSGSGAGAGSGSVASPGGNTSPGSGSGASSESSSPSGQPLSPAAAPSSAPAPFSNTSGSSGTSAPPAGGSSSSTCTQAGASICSPDGRQIGTCTAGMTVTWIPVAAGTKCSGGMMVMAGANKRSMRSGHGWTRRGSW